MPQVGEKFLTQILSRIDTRTNWQSEDPILGAGEIAFEVSNSSLESTPFEDLKMKVGDGKTNYNSLPYFSSGSTSGVRFFTVEVSGETTDTAGIAEVDPTPEEGDFCVVQRLIAGDSDSGKKQYTAYIYAKLNNSGDAAWQALDGNYDASNIYFNKDLIFTQAFGKYTPDSSGSVTIETNTNQMSLQNLLESAFAEEKNPTITQPSCSVTLSNSGAKEVGTEFTPQYSVSFNAGNYQYGPATAVTVESYNVTDTNSGSSTTQTGSFTEFTVTEDTNYKITASVTHTAGAIPKTNLGNNYEAGKIQGGSKTAQSSTVTGYRGWFQGYYNGTQALADATAITSAQLRAFGVRNGNFTNSITTNQMKQMFFAAPQGLVTSVGVANSVNGAPQTVNKMTVNVEGANNYEAIPYDVFYVANAVAESGSTTFTITTTKA